MSRPAGTLYQPVNRHPESIYEGWSWPCLFAGCFWFLAGFRHHIVYRGAAITS